MTTTAQLKAALIDMDGTLYDSMPLHAAAWSRLFRRLGIDHSTDEIYLYEGMTGAATIKLIFNRELHRDPSDDEVTKLYRVKTELFNQMPAPPPMPGARQMLDTLISRGIKRVLVTGSGQHSLIDRLERDFPGAFSRDLMITSADVTRGKPDPEPYLMAMQRAGVTAAEAMVVENAPLGVKSGAQSGAYTIGLTTGPIPAETLAEAGADIVLPSMQQFADKLPALIDMFNTGRIVHL